MYGLSTVILCMAATFLNGAFATAKESAVGCGEVQDVHRPAPKPPWHAPLHCGKSAIYLELRHISPTCT